MIALVLAMVGLVVPQQDAGGDAAARALLVPALARQQAQRQAARDYVADDSFELVTYDSNNDEVSRFTSSAEYIVVEGAPYERSAKVNGKRQTGTQLAAARANSKSRDAALLANQEAGLTPESGSSADVLTPAYTSRIVGEETVDGHQTVLVEALPAGPITNARAQQRRRFWIDRTTQDVVRTSAQTLADQDPGLLSSMKKAAAIELKGCTYTTTYAPVEGVWLLRDVVIDTYTRRKSDHVFLHMHAVSRRTHYQRFRAAMTILPATATEAEPAATGPESRPGVPQP